MKCQGDFVFRGLEKRDGGEFTNDKGQVIKYDSAFILKVDEVNDNGIFERKLKVSNNNTSLINKIKDLDPYTKITIEFNVVFYGSNINIIPIDLV